MVESAMSENFVGLLMQLHYTAWVQLGKVANPGTGKVERDLEAAKATIDVLGALEEKTKGNLHADEEKLLTRMLLELRMNYVEEAKQGTEAEGQHEAGPSSEPGAAPSPGSAGAGESGASSGGDVPSPGAGSGATGASEGSEKK